jgi:integrase
MRRPPVTTLSPRLGLSHLQFEAMLSAARQSPNPNEFALVCLLGLLELRIMEATGLDIDDLGEEHGHQVVRVLGKGNKVVLVPMPPAVARAVDRAIADAAADRSCSSATACSRFICICCTRARPTADQAGSGRRGAAPRRTLRRTRATNAPVGLLGIARCPYQLRQPMLTLLIVSM